MTFQGVNEKTSFQLIQEGYRALYRLKKSSWAALEPDQRNNLVIEFVVTKAAQMNLKGEIQVLEVNEWCIFFVR